MFLHWFRANWFATALSDGFKFWLPSPPPCPIIAKLESVPLPTLSEMYVAMPVPIYFSERWPLFSGCGTLLGLFLSITGA